MLAFPFALALAETVSPASEAFARYYGPIWEDIRLNGKIGNGNALMDSAWVFGREGEDVNLKMDAIDCRQAAAEARCVFSVSRQSSRPASAGVPALVHCQVTLSADEEGDWDVVHTTLRGVAQSRTSMQCRTDGQYPL